MNALEIRSHPPAPTFTTQRCEPRESVVRLVDYSCFPRPSADRGLRVGFTRDFSENGMCLGAEAAEEVGALLRLTLRHLDGRPARRVVGSVVWCEAARDGRYWLGLQLVAEGDADRMD